MCNFRHFAQNSGGRRGCVGENQTKSEDFEKKEGRRGKGRLLPSSVCSRCKVHKIEDVHFSLSAEDRETFLYSQAAITQRLIWKNCIVLDKYLSLQKGASDGLGQEKSGSVLGPSKKDGAKRAFSLYFNDMHHIIINYLPSSIKKALSWRTKNSKRTSNEIVPKWG